MIHIKIGLYTFIVSVSFFIFLLGFSALIFPDRAEASYHFSNFKGKPPIHIEGNTTKAPTGLSPNQIKAIYHLPETGGRGTIAIIGAYNDATIETDLALFDSKFNLPACTTNNGCFEKHLMHAGTKTNSGWSSETSLDVEWAHAIAPSAKILLVEAETQSGQNLLNAVDYATSRGDVKAISMSWGGGEFPEEVSLDSHFISKSGASFFASSGDNGAGASWPASSPNVIGVGGTSLTINSKGQVSSETAWTGSGGGISSFEKEPPFQKDYSIPKAGSMRAIPDVAYDADPKSGFSIVKNGKWYKVGGTSAGAPQWAALSTLGNNATNTHFYSDKESQNYAAYFNDIVSGSNGGCTYYCNARKHYDYLTGLGTPKTVNF